MSAADPAAPIAATTAACGPPEAATVLREALLPFADMGVAGAVSTKSRAVGGSDHTSFNAAGLPGISVNQDPIEYFTTTWHTNLDTYERILEDDGKQDAVIIATALYQLAMRDEMLPRFSRETMPPPPPPAAVTPQSEAKPAAKPRRKMGGRSRRH